MSENLGKTLAAKKFQALETAIHIFVDLGFELAAIENGIGSYEHGNSSHRDPNLSRNVGQSVERQAAPSHKIEIRVRRKEPSPVPKADAAQAQNTAVPEGSSGNIGSLHGNNSG